MLFSHLQHAFRDDVNYDVSHMPDERKIRVTCGTVSLQLTLGAKLLAKPFDEAVIKPFLTAYVKRTGEPAELSRVARVEVDEEMLGDTSIGASVVLLKNETVDAEIFLRPIEAQHTLRANEISADPFAPLPEILPSSGGASAGGRTLAAPPPRDMSKDTVDFDEDNLTPIERLKRERRAARERGEAASSIEILKQAAATSLVLQEVDATSVGASAAAQATVNAKPTSPQAAVPAMPQPTPPTPPPPPPPPLAVAASAANAATDALDEAESAVARLSAELAALTDACEDGAATGEAQREEASKRAAALLSQVGRVIQALDDVAMGHLADSDREDARARKKRAVATLEGTLLPAVQRVQQQLLPTTRDAGGRAAAPSAEIDSDED